MDKPTHLDLPSRGAREEYRLSPATVSILSFIEHRLRQCAEDLIVAACDDEKEAAAMSGRIQFGREVLDFIAAEPALPVVETTTTWRDSASLGPKRR